MEQTTEQKLIATLLEHPNAHSIIRLMRHDEAELTVRLRKQKKHEDMLFTQGQLDSLEKYISLLDKATN
jgi:hypothetical protein